MKSLIWLLLVFVSLANGDLSEYFARDFPSRGERFFNSQRNSPKKTTVDLSKASRKIDNIDYSDYYDYFNIDSVSFKDEKEEATVADDVLEEVKKPTKKDKFQKRKEKYPYRKRHHNDNIAMPSKNPMKVMKKSPVHPNRNAGFVKKSSMPRKPQANATKPRPFHQKPSFAALTAKVERLIPSKLKTVIEGEGKKIVKTVLQPVKKMTNEIQNTINNRDGNSVAQVEESVKTWFAPYRTYMESFAPIFSSDFVTKQCIGLWVNTIAATAAWVFFGSFYTTVSGRSLDSTPEPWEEFVPNKETMALVFDSLADVTRRWHDEL